MSSISLLFFIKTWNCRKIRSLIITIHNFSNNTMLYNFLSKISSKMKLAKQNLENIYIKLSMKWSDKAFSIEVFLAAIQYPTKVFLSFNDFGTLCALLFFRTLTTRKGCNVLNGSARCDVRVAFSNFCSAPARLSVLTPLTNWRDQILAISLVKNRRNSILGIWG